MNKIKSPAKFVFDEENQCYQCQGNWSITHLDKLSTRLDLAIKSNDIVISGAKLDYFDSAGALILHHFINSLKDQGKTIKLIDFSKQQKALLHLIQDKNEII